MPYDIVCLVAKVTDGMRRFAFCKQKKRGTKIFAYVFETFNAEYEEQKYLRLFLKHLTPSTRLAGRRCLCSSV